jgi:hypothetical protein
MTRRSCWSLGACLLAMLVVAPAEEIHVVAVPSGGQLLVSFSCDNGFSQEIREAIRSGLPTTISYEVDLRRTVSIWFDQTLARATVTAGARYDNLTRLHQLSRTIDGRGEAPRVTDSEESVRQWMTRFDRLPLFATDELEPNGEYYVRVRARSRPRLGWFAWPWDRGWATGRAKFTFVQ